MPGKYSRQQADVPLSEIGFLVGSAVDKLSADLLTEFPINKDAFPRDTWGLLEPVLVNLHVGFPHDRNHPGQTGYAPFVTTEYNLAVIAAQIEEFMAGRPGDIQARWRAAVDRERANRRAHYAAQRERGQ